MTTEIGRIFCPSCGNGGTLRKVAVTVGENGMVVAARRPRISLRGTKVSIYIYISGFHFSSEDFKRKFYGFSASLVILWYSINHSTCIADTC